MGALVPDGRDRFPVSQRTLDLKTESAYFRVRLCVPRPRARPASLRPFNHQPSAHPPVPRSPTVRSELVGSSEPPSAAAFATVITHALAKTHGVVGGAIPIDHLSFEPEIEWDRLGATRGRDHRGSGRLRRRRAMPRRRRAKGADRAGDADDDARRDGMSRERARRGEIVGRPRRRVRRERPGAAVDRLIIERPPYS